MSQENLPPHERPSPEKLRIYGDFSFLAMRSPRHLTMSVANLRAAFEPPIELGQYKIFRFDDIPRGLFTWAMFDRATEEKYIQGGQLAAKDWRSGERLWLIDIIAPYKGLTASISRWIMQPGNVTEQQFYFRRVKGKAQTRRIVKVDFTDPNKKARIYSQGDFLNQK